MVKSVSEFSGYEVLDWYDIHTASYFSLEEVACLLLNVNWYEWRNKFSQSTHVEDSVLIRKFDSALAIKYRELENFAEQYKGVLVEFDPGLATYLIFYTKESVKAFLLKCYPNERPRFLYPDAVPVLSEDEADRKELRELRDNVKQLQKLVIGIAVDQLDYDPYSSPKSMLGMKAIEAMLENAQDKINSEAKANNQPEIKITLSDRTIKKYLVQAYDSLKQE